MIQFTKLFTISVVLTMLAFTATARPVCWTNFSTPAQDCEALGTEGRLCQMEDRWANIKTIEGDDTHFTTFEGIGDDTAGLFAYYHYRTDHPKENYTHLQQFAWWIGQQKQILGATTEMEFVGNSKIHPEIGAYSPTSDCGDLDVEVHTGEIDGTPVWMATMTITLTEVTHHFGITTANETDFMSHLNDLWDYSRGFYLSRTVNGAAQ